MAVEDFASRLRELFAPQMADDARAREFKKYVVRQLRLNLPPGPGRPVDAAVTVALELRRRGVPWHGVCEQCVPDFRGLPRGQQQLAKSALRSKCRSRRNTRRRRVVRLRRRENLKALSDPEQHTA